MDEYTVQPATAETAEAARTEETRPSRRYDRQGFRRGRYGYAAPVGWLISVLCLVGAVAIVMGGVSLFHRPGNDEALKEEFYYYLEPVLSYTPEPFEDVTLVEQDAFLQAAAYRVSLAEQNRMLSENDESCRYAVDDAGRIVVPVSELEAAYDALFGTLSPLTHRSLEADNLLYSAADKCYYVPFQSLQTGYTPVVDTVKKKGDTYTVRVGFVANKDVKINEHGKQVPPTADMATYVQVYTLKKAVTGYYIQSCANE